MPIQAQKNARKKQRRRADGSLASPNWGGARPGAGRKPNGLTAGVSHAVRPPHVPAHPVSVTFRAKKDVPGMSTKAVFPEVLEAIAASHRPDFRVLHFSVLRDRVKLLVEANDTHGLRFGVQGVAIRVARAVNRAGGRKGKVWADRNDTRALRTPREVRDWLVELLHEQAKQSSAAWFDGWTARAAPAKAKLLADPSDVPCPIAKPKTPLARVGWRKLGLLDPKERPPESTTPTS